MESKKLGSEQIKSFASYKVAPTNSNSDKYAKVPHKNKASYVVLTSYKHQLNKNPSIKVPVISELFSRSMECLITSVNRIAPRTALD